MHQCADISGVPAPGKEVRRCRTCGRIWRYKKTCFGIGLFAWVPAGRVLQWAVRHGKAVW